MKKEIYRNLTTEDLIKKKKSFKFLTGILIGALMALLVLTVYNTINDGFTPLLIVPFALSPILVMNYLQIVSINKELKNRI